MKLLHKMTAKQKKNQIFHLSREKLEILTVDSL